MVVWSSACRSESFLFGEWWGQMSSFRSKELLCAPKHLGETPLFGSSQRIFLLAEIAPFLGFLPKRSDKDSIICAQRRQQRNNRRIHEANHVKRGRRLEVSSVEKVSTSHALRKRSHEIWSCIRRNHGGQTLTNFSISGV